MSDTEQFFKGLEADWTKTLPGAGYYKILRLDGRNFSKFTKNMDKPFDLEFCKNMDIVAVQLCKEIQGVKFAYVQSDEISFLVWQDGEKSQQWFGGDLAKTLSVSAGLASSAMSLLYTQHSTHQETGRLAPVMFDARVFTVPDKISVIRYFMWRQADAYRNAVSMAASAVFSHKQLMGKTVWDRLEMLRDEGIDFHATYPRYIGHGRVVVPMQEMGQVTYSRKDTKETVTTEVLRTVWRPGQAPSFDWDEAGWLEVNIP